MRMNNAESPGMTQESKLLLLWWVDGPSRFMHGPGRAGLDRAFGQAPANSASQWSQKHHRGRAVRFDGGVPCLAWGGSVLGQSRQAKASSQLPHMPNRGACVCLGMPGATQDAQGDSLVDATSVGEVRTSTVARSGVRVSGCQAFRERPVRSKCQPDGRMGRARLCR